MALQLRATKRCWRRGLVWWIARATTSLPVPVSPVMSTVARARRHGLDHLAEVAHRPAAADHARQPVALLELLAQVGVLGAQPPLLERRFEHVQQLVELERLADEVGGAALDGVDGVLDGAVAGDDDADDARVALQGRVEHLAAVDAGQAQVRDQDVEGELLELLEGLLAGRRPRSTCEARVGEALGHDGAQGVFVVDEQQMDGFGQRGSAVSEGVNILTLTIREASTPKSVVGLAQPCPNPHGDSNRYQPLKENDLWNVRPSAS